MDLASLIAYRSIPEPNSGCWIWLGALTDGYGSMVVGRGTDKVHRLMWLVTHGEIPAGICVLHHCDNRACCNPDHLYLGTKLDNARDRVRRKREGDRRGEKNGRAKLTADDVRTIRSSKTNQCVLAADYGISQAMVSQIQRGVAWRHI
jgi:hypothetical protein